MEDYRGNSNKAKAKTEEQAEEKPAKNLEKVIVGEAVIQKKGLGRKFKDMILDIDLKDIGRNVFSNVILPTAKNMLYDAWVDTGKQALYRGGSPGPRGGLGLDPRSLVQRVIYNTPVQRMNYPRDPREMHRPSAPPIEVGPRNSSRYADVEGVMVGSKIEADLVLERMNDVVEQYDVVSVHDLKELLGVERSHVDQKWGWITVVDVPVRQTRDGYLIEFPPAQPIHT